MKMIQTRVTQNKDEPQKHNFKAKKNEVIEYIEFVFMFKNFQTIFYPSFLVKI